MDEEDPVEIEAVVANAATTTIAKVVKNLVKRFGDGTGRFDPVYVRDMNIAKNEKRIRNAVYKTALKSIKEQDNIDKILQIAAPMLTVNARPEEVDQDLINLLADKMRLTEDDDMRRLWAKLIAGEAEAPGRFSKRVVDEVARLSREEAQAFTALAGYVWTIKTKDDVSRADTTYPILVIPNDLSRDEPIPLSQMQKLEEANLIVGNIDHLRLAGVPQGTLVEIHYHERYCRLLLKSNQGVKFGRQAISLTSIGRALFPICGGSPVVGVFEKMVNFWSQGSDFDVIGHNASK